MRENAINIPSLFRDEFMQIISLANRSIELSGNITKQEGMKVIDWLLRGHDVALIKDEVMGDYFSRVTYPHVDEYGIPDECYTVRLYSAGAHYSKGEFVPLYISPTFDNRLVTRRILEYARVLTLIDKIINVNINIQRTPYIINASRDNIVAIQKLWDELESCASALCTEHNNLGTKIEILDLNAPFLADKLYDLRNAIKYEMLTFLGINNSSIDKSQYVSDFENSTNNECTTVYQDCIIGTLNDSLEGTGYTAKARYEKIEGSEDSGLASDNE